MGGNRKRTEGVATGASQSENFPALRYANCWEDAHVLCEALRPAPGMRILSIASGGDNSFALAAEGAEVVAADLNPSQIACAELKQAAIRRLEYDVLLAFLGFRKDGDRRSTFLQLASGLSPRSQRYWEGRAAAIDRGFAHSGKFEKYFATFRRRVLPLVHRRSVVESGLVERSRQERESFYREVWNNRRWRMLFRLFFSRAVMGAIGRDRATFRYVEGTVAEKIMERARRALIDLPTHANPFLEYIATGSFERCLPRYLEKQRFEALREGIDRVTFIEGPIEEVASQHAGDGFDGFNLSDIFEYLDEDAGRQLYGELLECGRSGARLAYWNMLVPRRFAKTTAGRVTELEDLAERLYAKDFGFFYGALIIEEVCS